jgi:hypothetical protein
MKSANKNMYISTAFKDGFQAQECGQILLSVPDLPLANPSEY